MNWGVVVFPGSNDDSDTLHVIGEILGEPVRPLWHKDADLGDVDAVVLPGGFSYGDYLRCGALARFSPVMESVSRFAADGGLVLGICNGFQVLCESGLLPGALVRNRSLRFICAPANIRVEHSDSPLTKGCAAGESLRIPIKHGEGCYIAADDTLDAMEAKGQVLFRYVDELGQATAAANPNGSMRNIAGVQNEAGNVFGLMPHPEHAAEDFVGTRDGLELFRSLSAARAD